MEVIIKITTNYTDLQLNRLVVKGETLKVTKERGDQIAKAGYGVIQEILKTENKAIVPQTEIKAKRTRKKK